jgi:hypothetical protein
MVPNDPNRPVPPGARRSGLRRAACAALAMLGACTPYPDEPQVVGGYVTLKTYGDLATAATRARLACGEPKRFPALMRIDGEGSGQTATFNCM